MRRLPALEMSNPEIVMPQICPMGIIKRMVPHAASPNPNAILMSGIRLAQLEKQIPVQKYRQNIARRMRPLDSNFIAQK
jgi:hypothetical protein